VDEGLDVQAEILPCAGCVVDLLVALGKCVVRVERGVAECENDCVLDGCVGGAVVHWLCCGVRKVPGSLVGGVLVDVLHEFVEWRCAEGSWQVRAHRYGFHDRVVGGVADRRLL